MAASTIKGITIEIGGDTTKLSKALEGVNKSIKTTQAGLKDVNKLLKLDPSNTEAVTQKQRMLKDAIEAILSTRNIVDVLSLALALREDADERVKEAVEEMLNELWGRIDGYRN